MLGQGRAPHPAESPLGGRRLTQFAFAAVAAIALVTTVLYATMGRPDLAKRKDSGLGPRDLASEAEPASHPGGDVSTMIGQLEGELREQPNNAQGWAMLGWSYFQTHRYPQAAKAYAHAADLDPSDAESLSALGESLVRSNDGLVAPDADTAFRRALAADPGDPRARYFLAVEKDQKGDHRGAMDDWTALLRTAPPNAAWAQEVRAFVLKVAASRGEDIAASLPPATGDTAAPSSPTPDEVAAASQMPEADRQKMILGMVDGLAARLKARPHDVDGWSRLLRARMVLGQADQAALAYRDARKVLTGAELAQVRDAARTSGVPGT
jgi:cytochrome c-type biogenesis protein CcmH